MKNLESTYAFSQFKLTTKPQVSVCPDTSTDKCATPDFLSANESCLDEFEFQDNDFKRISIYEVLNEENRYGRKVMMNKNLADVSMCSVVILGELSVGKSALCRSFFQQNFEQYQTPNHKNMKENLITFDDLLDENQEEADKNHHVFELPVFVDGSRSKMRILDVNTEKHFLESTSEEGFVDLQQYLAVGDGYIVAYAVTDKKTFQTAQKILIRIREFVSSQKFPVLLVGNKCDLVRKRQVSTKDGIKVAEKHRVKFIETSATLNQNVEQLFQGIVTQIRLIGYERQTKAAVGTASKTGKNLVVVASRSCGASKNLNNTLQMPLNSEKTKKESLKGKYFGKILKPKKSKTSPNGCQDFSHL